MDLPSNALVNPVCGALGTDALPDHSVSATAPVTGSFAARSKFGLHRVWWSGHAESFAKSEILGALEGLERHDGQVPGGRDVSILAPATKLADEYLDPREYPQYSDAFYDAHVTYCRWTPEMECNWVWGYSLRAGRPLLVPEQLVYYLDRNPTGKNFVQECSNGCAVGSVLEEAVLHGLLEVVERDAFLLMWYGKLVPKEIDLDSVNSWLVRAMAIRMALIGYDLRCFDIRVDTSIPVVAAVAVRRDGGVGTLCFAAGCSLEPEDAVRAAVCEVAAYVPSLRERVLAQQEVLANMISDFSLVSDLEHHALVHGLPEMRKYSTFLLDQDRTYPLSQLYGEESHRRLYRADLSDDLLAVVNEVVHIGSDVIMVDQTSLEQSLLGMRTVCVLAPGLLPIDFGWDRQRALRSPRLRSASAAAGPGSGALTDADINGAPHPFP
jgi:ribosomal protein S12 methylthiotransferase accessory factor